MRFTRQQAAQFKLPFGKYEHQTLMQIANQVGGMKYLISLQLQKHIESCPVHLHHDFKDALWVFIHTVDTDRR